jgi:hypothetical protein
MRIAAIGVTVEAMEDSREASYGKYCRGMDSKCLRRKSVTVRTLFLAGLIALQVPVASRSEPLGNVANLGISNVFLIMLENHDWSTISGSPNCPFINKTLLPRASLANQYFTPPDNHPSEPNYIWLVSGTNFGIRDDHSPATNQKNTTNHLAYLLDQAGVSWRTYQEDITGTDIPLVNHYPYAVRHNPFMFFKNITTNLSYVTNHVRPFSELSGDLADNSVAHFNFISPNVTNDMHDGVGGISSRILGDSWLSRHVPAILKSAAFTNGGVLFIAWDEGSLGTSTGESDGPLGLIVLSPMAKGRGYISSLHYTHSSTLRTFQDILGVHPYLGDARNATDLSDLFFSLPRITDVVLSPTGGYGVSSRDAWIGRTHHLQFSEDLAPDSWHTVVTQVATQSTLQFTTPVFPEQTMGFYRLLVDP